MDTGGTKSNFSRQTDTNRCVPPITNNNRSVICTRRAEIVMPVLVGSCRFDEKKLRLAIAPRESWAVHHLTPDQFNLKCYSSHKRSNLNYVVPAIESYRYCTTAYTFVSYKLLAQKLSVSHDFTL